MRSAGDGWVEKVNQAILLIKKVDKKNSKDSEKIEKLNDSIEILLEKIKTLENKLE